MNLGENNNLFRESFRGFNKDDVAEYITKLSKDYTINEDKYKEHIAKLTAELKHKTGEIANLNSGREEQTAVLKNMEKKYRDEIRKLASELNERDMEINILRSKPEPDKDLADAPDTEEIAEYKETIAALTKEIESIREEYNKAETEKAVKRESEAVNQLSFQLAESESERLFLMNLLKKTIFTLGIESIGGKNIEFTGNIFDAASKFAVAEEIDTEIRSLAGFKEKAAELEAENAELKENVKKNQIALSDEQKMYKSVTSDLGEIIYSAKKSAEELLAKAKIEADDIVYKAKIEAGAIIDKANEKRADITDKNRKDLQRLKEKYEFIKKEHENMLRKYKEISERYTFRLSEIESVVNSVYESVNEEDFSD